MGKMITSGLGDFSFFRKRVDDNPRHNILQDEIYKEEESQVKNPSRIELVCLLMTGPV